MSTHERREPRRLTKRRPQRASSVQFPERLKEGPDVNDDVAGGKETQRLNQSVFNMVAAAGSQVDFHARFDDISSESETELSNSQVPEDVNAGRDLASEGRASRDGDKAPSSSPAKAKKHAGGKKRMSVDRGLLKSLPKLSMRHTRERDPMSQSQILPPKGEAPSENVPSSTTLSKVTPRDAPVMSRMLEAEARLESSTGTIDVALPLEKFEERMSSTLAKRLMEIFGFEEPEDVIAEYPCWLLQTLLLQGYLYVTTKHICFYAYLPRKSTIIAKSGYLSKKGKSNPRFNRLWFVLKGDVLSYYANPSEKYFPTGNIDLRYAISASLSEHKEKGKDNAYFTIVTNQRNYHLKADSTPSAKEWVKMLQKVIFRSHNDGDSVKISMPIDNVADVEETSLVDFVQTLKIRVIDSDETYAVDEYYFSFFNFGKDAYELLRSKIHGSTAQAIPTELLSPAAESDNGSQSRRSSRGPRKSLEVRSPSFGGANTPTLHEGVRATLAPISPISSGKNSPRPSGDWGRNSMDASRKSLDLAREVFSHPRGDKRRSASGRRAVSASRTRSDIPGTKPNESLDSFVHSVEQGTDSSAAHYSHTDTDPSGSQILKNSEVFPSPTIYRLKDSKRPRSSQRRRSEDSTHTREVPSQIQVHSPSRAMTQYNLKEPPRPSSDHPDRGRPPLKQSNSSAGIKQLVDPLQRATGYIFNRSKRMSNLLATESMGYVEKVHGMWQGGRKHYDETEGVVPDNQIEDYLDDDDEGAGYGERFRAHFALPETEKLQATYFGYLHRVLPLYGKIYISDHRFCFRSLLPGTRTKMILPLRDIENVDKEKGFTFGSAGLVICIRGHEELFFEFRQSETRDDCAVTLLAKLECMKCVDESILLQEDKDQADLAEAEHRLLQEARQESRNDQDVDQTLEDAHHEDEGHQVFFDDPLASILNFKPAESLRVTCLTIGSRGDVQPYIALCKGLLAEGHKVKIATHAEFELWIRSHGIEFARVEGDPAELMRICVEFGMFTMQFLREANSKFRGWIDELLSSAWQACQDTDLLIESPSAMAGIHIAEALGIPYFRAFTMPWTRTRAYPHAFAVPEKKLGGQYNYLTYIAFDNIFWKATAGQINRWRRKELGLRSTTITELRPNKVPFLYNFSPSVVPPPIDYSDWIRVTGYWFLDEAQSYRPPPELVAFIARARSDGKRLVYVGFGSIVVSNSAALTEAVVESVLRADVRCILSKGWSDRLGAKDASKLEVPLPPEIHQITSAPHDWLFQQIDAAAHHGGAGTTGASLRWGLPTVIKPFFGDQFFFSTRVHDLGVGIALKRINVSLFSRALYTATHDERMRLKAKRLGEQIRGERGVETAIKALYRDMEYAKSLVKRRKGGILGQEGDALEAHETIGVGADEESWTFVGAEDGTTDAAVRERIVRGREAARDRGPRPAAAATSSSAAAGSAGDGTDGASGAS